MSTAETGAAFAGVDHCQKVGLPINNELQRQILCFGFYPEIRATNLFGAVIFEESIRDKLLGRP